MGIFFLLLEAFFAVIVGFVAAKGELGFSSIAGTFLISQAISHMYFLAGIGLAATTTFWVFIVCTLVAFVGSYIFFKIRHKHTRRRY